MSLYAADGSFNVTVVDGTTIGGLQAADGSYNVVQVDGTSIVGLHHACGAYNVVHGTVGSIYDSPHHACGAYYVSVSPYLPNTMQVTVVSGSLT